MIPHARGPRARVGGTILFDGMSQPGGSSAVAARPDPADRSRSGPRDDVRPAQALKAAPRGTTPWVAYRQRAVTSWTMLRGAAWATTVIRSGVDAKDDPHLIIVDLDPPDQGADEIAPGSPVRRRQPVPDHPGEALEPADDQSQRSRPGGGIPQRGGLGLELAHALP